MRVRKNYLEGLIALLLLGVFAVCLFMILLTGANTYHRLTRKGEPSYDRRICTQYIATQLRSADRLDSISVQPFGSGNALALEEMIDGKPYVTRIYTFHGYLMELFSAGSSDLAPEDGRKIMPLDKLDLTLENGLLHIICTDAQGTRTALDLALRCGKEAAE